MSKDKNKEVIKSLKNKHVGEIGLVVANGPSLNLRQLEDFPNTVGFGFNKIYLGFDDTEWRPDYYMVADALVAEINSEQIAKLPGQKIYGSSAADYLAETSNYCVVPPPPGKNQFAKVAQLLGLGRKEWNPVTGIRAGYSVVGFGLKMAFYMGIRNVMVVGLDHRFIVPSTKTGEILHNNSVLLADGEKNHFHPDYRSKGEKWTTPQIEKISREFDEISSIYRKHGGRILNACLSSAYSGWEKMDPSSAYLELIQKEQRPKNETS